MRLVAAVVLSSVLVSGCVFGGDNDVSSASKEQIAKCGAGINVANRSSLKLKLSDGLNLSVSRREELRAAFLEGFLESDMPSRVSAYTEYVGCITNQLERELALSEILERKIRFLSHMESQGLPEQDVEKVAQFYDRQYEETQAGNVAKANDQYGKIAVAYFDAVRSTGTPLGQLTPMPPPSPELTASSSAPTQTPEEIRRMRIQYATYSLQAAAARNMSDAADITEAAEVCREFFSYFVCKEAMNE